MTSVCRGGAPLAALIFGLSLAADAGAQDALRVRVSAETAPCVAAAISGFSGGRGVVLETAGLRDPGPMDVVVGTGAEMTRALEGGQAVVNSDVPIAEIPWVLSVVAGNPLGLTGLEDARRKGVEVVVFGGPAAYEARRAVAGGGTVREATDRTALRGAPVALVPLSLAGGGARIAVSEVPPLRTSAAVAAHAAQPERALEFVRYLGSEAGQKAFTACGSAASR